MDSSKTDNHGKGVLSVPNSLTNRGISLYYTTPINPNRSSYLILEKKLMHYAYSVVIPEGFKTSSPPLKCGVRLLPELEKKCTLGSNPSVGLGRHFSTYLSCYSIDSLCSQLNRINVWFEKSGYSNKNCKLTITYLDESKGKEDYINLVKGEVNVWLKEQGVVINKDTVIKDSNLHDKIELFLECDAK